MGYIARISLDANNPGNGMGGSTKRAVSVALPAGIPDNTVPTACGGGAYVPTGAAPDATPSVARRGTALTASLGAVGFANIGKNRHLHQRTLRLHSKRNRHCCLKHCHHGVRDERYYSGSNQFCTVSGGGDCCPRRRCSGGNGWPNCEHKHGYHCSHSG